MLWPGPSSCPDVQDQAVRQGVPAFGHYTIGLLSAKQGVTHVKNFVCFCILAGLLILAVKGINDTNSRQARAHTGVSHSSHKSVSTSSQPGPGTGDPDQLQRSPSISADFINLVLAAGHSPAAGTGEALYNLGVQYGIDPAYALAFFLHESSLGKTGVANATQSLGNIRCSNGYRCIDGFRAYQTWPDGYRDWYRLILYGYVQGQITIPLAGHKCTTVEQIIPVYAPASDHNDEAAYIAAIRHAVQTWRAGEVSI